MLRECIDATKLAAPPSRDEAVERRPFGRLGERESARRSSCGPAIALALRYDRPEHDCTTHTTLTMIASSDAEAIDLHRRLRLRSERELCGESAEKS